MRRWQLVLDYTGSVEGIYAIIYCTKWRSGQVSRIPYSMTTLKDFATQLLKKYKSGALVTQIVIIIIVTEIISKAASGQIKAFVGKFRELWAAL